MISKIPKNKVAVTPLYDPERTKGGLYIPDEAKERCDQGIIKYLGSDVRDLEIGDHVLFSGQSGTLVKVEGEGSLIFLLESDCVCVLGSPNTIVPGLYFKDQDGYFTATYEQAQTIMANALSETKEFKSMRMKFRTKLINEERKDERPTYRPG